jgi:hypothetical protein
MPRAKKLVAKHAAGGLNAGTGVFNLKAEENVESRNMEYTIDGAAATSLGYDDVGMDWGEDGERVDGLHRVALYPDLVFNAVGGAMKYADFATAPQSTALAYTADSGISLTPGNPVFMRDYRGVLYYCNGVEDAGTVSIGRLAQQLTTTPADETKSIRTGAYTWVLSAQGTNEYYLQYGGGQPDISEPTSVLFNGVAATPGSVTLLTAGQWDWGNADSLGYTTVYVRLADNTDPDTKAVDFVQAVFADQLILNDAEGYRFASNFRSSSGGLSADRVYIEGDEIDYSAVSDVGVGDKLYPATNIATTHPEGAYVTQANAMVPPPNGSLKAKTLAFFRDTCWIAGMPDEPGVLRYSKSIETVESLIDGDLSNFSDGENYIIGDGGEITALQATENRLYVFMKDAVHFIGVVYASTGTPVFDTSKKFTGVYGCPNAFCVTEMEDVVVFFTGKRLIRIGYDPNGQELIPDESFDREILPLLQEADEDQTNARISYNAADKTLRIKFIVNGVAKVIKYHKQQDKYSGLSDEDASCYVVHRKNTYFGDVNSDIVWKIGKSIDSEDSNTRHRYESGRRDGGTKNWKLYKRGRVRGKKKIGAKVYLVTKVDGKNWGAARLIPEEAMDLSATATPLGEAVTGADTVGLSGDTNNLFPYDYPFLVGRRGKDYSFAISSDDSGAIWTLENDEIEWEEYDTEPRNTY